MIKIFEDDDSAEVILSHVLEQGIVGIAGGRMSTRNKLGAVRSMAEQARHHEIVALYTVNHYWGELAYIYDDKFYQPEGAEQAVIEAYDKLLAEQGVFPDTYLGAE